MLEFFRVATVERCSRLSNTFISSAYFSVRYEDKSAEYRNIIGHASPTYHSFMIAKLQSYTCIDVYIYSQLRWFLFFVKSVKKRETVEAAISDESKVARFPRTLI